MHPSKFYFRMRKVVFKFFTYQKIIFNFFIKVKFYFSKCDFYQNLIPCIHE